MSLNIIAIAILIVVFTVGTMRKVHIGLLALAAAFGVGILLSGMTLDEISEGFPVSILLLLLGVTLFFGIAHENGTIERLIDASLAWVGDRAGLLPAVFFLLACGLAAMGSSLAALALAPIGMPIAQRYRIDPVLMGLSIGTGLTAGAFAPTSLFGIIAYGTAREAQIDLNPLILFTVSFVINLVLLALAYTIFGGWRLFRNNNPNEGLQGTDGSLTANEGEPASNCRTATATATETRRLTFTNIQKTTLVFIGVLIVGVIVLTLAGQDPDIGVLCIALSAVLVLIDPSVTKPALGRIDWSTILLVGGVITYVSILEHMGAVELLGEAAESLGTPLISAFALCVIGGLVSAFASTTGMLAAIIPLAIPLIGAGHIPGWTLITALAICSALVDVSPYSTVGATIISTSEENERPRVTSVLMKWGMSMVVVGPILLVGFLVVPSTLSS